MEDRASRAACERFHAWLNRRWVPGSYCSWYGQFPPGARSASEVAIKIEPLQVSWAWLAGLAPSGFDAALTQTDRDYVNAPRWLAWWDSLGVGDEVFAAIYVEDRQKTSHRVTKSKKGITIGLGVPAQEARAASDLRAYMRTQEFNLWHRAAEKLAQAT